MEAGQVVPATGATLGYEGWFLPGYSAHPAVITFLQASTLAISLLLTWALTQKIGRQSFTSLWPQHLIAVSLMACFWKTIVGT
jgi:hypothetical protein